MRIIQFRNHQLLDEVKTDEKPVLNIVRVSFVTQNPDWVSRLASSSLTLKTTCYDSANGNMIYNYSQIISLGSYITPYTKVPVLDINYLDKFYNPAHNFIAPRKVYFITTIELIGIQLEDDEQIEVSVIERTYILQRIEDWRTRITNLYNQIADWLQEEPGYRCEAGHTTTMYEDLMQTFEVRQQTLETLDIYHGGKILLALKPKGLWMVAANGRIDIISAKGSLLLVDLAEAFAEPQWHIYTTDRKTKSPFNKNVFFKILLTLMQ